MSLSFIDQVRAIVMNNLSDEKFGVRYLASELGLSSSQTLRKIKNATGKSANQFIRKIRLEEAAKLLKNTDHTVAEIAFQVGFNSASYFNSTFSKYFGIAPGEYKTSANTLDELNDLKPKGSVRNFFTTKKFIYVFVIALLGVTGYFLINNFNSNKTPFPKKTIAVLPFKDFSPEDNQWFSDGISDNILHSLAQMKDLSVISFTSSSTYRDSNKQIPVIAKELGVSYILEGSITLVEDKIKIIIQLIDENDKHVWSKEYNENFHDVIAIQQNVAKEILNQLEITLSPKEKVILAKFPTENMEAYNLFLKGKLVNNSRSTEDLLKNIELNKQAIALDSNFSESYAEVAHSYWQLARFHGYKGIIDAFEGIDFAHKYADSAISINPNTFRAWSVKAALSQYNDWDQANTYYQKALAINPNDALTHLEYAYYFQLRPNPDIKKYLEQLTVSQQLDPISWLQANSYLYALIFNHKLEEAQDFLNKNKFQLSDRQIRSVEYRIIAYKNKDWSNVIPFLKNKLEKYPDSSLYYSELAFASSAILNDKKAAVDYMKQAYAIDSTNIYNVVPYIDVLLEYKKFAEADRFMASENYNSVLPKRFQINKLWYSYYLKGEVDKALEVSRNHLFTNDYLLQVLTYARLGDRKKVDSINKKYPYGTGVLMMWRANKAILHAVLKDRDSMYYYLEHLKFDDYVLYANRRTEFDPYRNEDRFKAFLRLNYLPVGISK